MSGRTERTADSDIVGNNFFRTLTLVHLNGYKVLINSNPLNVNIETLTTSQNKNAARLIYSILKNEL